MKKGIFCSILFALISMLLGFSVTQAQTSGTLNFTVNPVSHSGSYGTKYVVAVWIENASGTFIKTKLKYSASKNYDHLGTWTSKSSQNTVDATTGATLTAYSPLSFSWDGTNVSNTNVADGDYKIWIELAWDKSLTTGKTVTSYTFTKGPNASHLTPANTTLYTDVAIDWLPLKTGIENSSRSKDIRVFPNPTNGIVTIELNSVSEDLKMEVVNELGVIVSERKIVKGETGMENIDLSKFLNGIYFISLKQNNNHQVAQYRVLLKK
jgi:hypothetical protein